MHNISVKVILYLLSSVEKGKHKRVGWLVAMWCVIAYLYIIDTPALQTLSSTLQFHQPTWVTTINQLITVQQNHVSELLLVKIILQCYDWLESLDENARRWLWSHVGWCWWNPWILYVYICHHICRVCVRIASTILCIYVCVCVFVCICDIVCKCVDILSNLRRWTFRFVWVVWVIVVGQICRVAHIYYSIRN